MTARPCEFCGEMGVRQRASVRFCSQRCYLAHLNARPPAERIYARTVVLAGGCWQWTGATANGYGNLNVNGKRVKAHRLAYETFVGPIPEGLQIDHLCRNTRCVNPRHLEAVTQRENILRGKSPSANQARRTHCVNGHPFDEANTYVRPDTGGRCCRTCYRARLAKKAAAHA